MKSSIGSMRENIKRKERVIDSYARDNALLIEFIAKLAGDTTLPYRIITSAHRILAELSRTEMDGWMEDHERRTNNATDL